MKRILFLTFYFKPDLCAGSFRNSPLLEELGKQTEQSDVYIDVFTTLPNRYSTFSQEADALEINGHVKIERIKIPQHQSGIRDQSLSFKTYFDEVRKRTRKESYDLVYASSSRLFTAYLGYRIAKSRNIPLYLDIRDIFVDTINEVLQSKIMKAGAIPLLKIIEKKTFNYARHINLISGGFKPYFSDYKHADYTYFSNGIDEVFIEAYQQLLQDPAFGNKKRIVYAGNVGEGQGLHKIIPAAAKLLGNGFEFLIIGDGGAKQTLIDQVNAMGVKNVVFNDPVDREQLIQEYRRADYLFMHLNDYEAFKKVLPSKIFELAMFKKPILAGVGGFARDFIEEHLPDSILFSPGNAKELVDKLFENEANLYKPIDRSKFIANFNRNSINRKMAESILDLLHK